MRISDWSSDVCSSDLVAGHLATDAGRLEDVHRLQQQRIYQADVAGHGSQLGGAAEPLEHRVDVVHGVTELVDGHVDRLTEVAVSVERVCFEEGPDLVGRREEPLVGGEGLLLGGEDRDDVARSEEHTYELQSLMRLSYAVFCLHKQNTTMIVYDT